MKRRKRPRGAPAVAGLLALLIGLLGPAVARQNVAAFGFADTVSRRAAPADDLDDVLEAVGDVVETLFSEGVEEVVETLDATVAALDRPQFAAALAVSVGAQPRDVALGDFNADTSPDLAVAVGDSDVRVLMNTTAPGTGVFSAAVSPVSVGAAQEGVAVGDFNADGRPDLAAAVAGDVRVVMNNTPPGGGSFTPFPVLNILTLGGTSRDVAVGDFNGDGKPDLAVADVSGFVRVVPNNTLAGSGVFTVGPAPLTDISVPMGGQPVDVAVGDFDGDDKPDLVVANFSGTVGVLLNTTTAAGLAFTATAIAVGDSPRSVAVGDFNDDDDLDVVVAKRGSDEVAVLLGEGDGTFELPVGFPVGDPATAGDAPTGVAVGDFNGGGKLDVVTANFDAADISVLLGNGRGGLGPPTNFDVGTNPRSVAVGDLNLDDKLDLAVANSGTTTVSVLINTAAATP